MMSAEFRSRWSSGLATLPDDVALGRVKAFVTRSVRRVHIGVMFGLDLYACETVPINEVRLESHDGELRGRIRLYTGVENGGERER